MEPHRDMFKNNYSSLYQSDEINHTSTSTSVGIYSLCLMLSSIRLNMVWIERGGELQ